MSGPPHCMGMYHWKDKHTNDIQDEFINDVEEFDSFAHSHHEFMVNKLYHCPCAKCKNTKYLDPNVIKLHL